MKNCSCSSEDSIVPQGGSLEERGQSGFLWALLTVHKYTLSPLLHAISGPAAGCRFQPTCSEYAVLALRVHGLVRGGRLAGWRLLRCHPFARGGFDPVPAKRGCASAKTPAV